MSEKKAAARWFCYLIECADGTFYTGITTDVERRVSEHAKGKGSKYARSRLPVRLVHAEPHPDRSSAARREAAIRKMSRAGKEGLLGGKGSPVIQ